MVPGGRDSQGLWESHVHTTVFNMENQQKTYCIAQGTLLNVMCQPEWEPGLGEKGYMYMFG